jgi:metal-dependent amidase/aminoacylase/carboxypeptidase family protein
VDQGFGLSTLTHARLGEPTFGIAPGDGELLVTLRSRSDTHMDNMIAQAENILANGNDPVEIEINWHDVFLAAVNSPEATGICRNATVSQGRIAHEMAHPMRWSEGFGRFGLGGAQTAMLFLELVAPDQIQDLPNRLN